MKEYPEPDRKWCLLLQGTDEDCVKLLCSYPCCSAIYIYKCYKKSIDSSKSPHVSLLRHKYAYLFFKSPILYSDLTIMLNECGYQHNPRVVSLRSLAHFENVVTYKYDHRTPVDEPTGAVAANDIAAIHQNQITT